MHQIVDLKTASSSLVIPAILPLDNSSCSRIVCFIVNEDITDVGGMGNGLETHASLTLNHGHKSNPLGFAAYEYMAHRGLQSDSF